MQVTILGTACECRNLEPVGRLRWNLYLHDECERTFYGDLFATVEHLPVQVQLVVMQKHRPPDRLDNTMPIYYKLASKPAAVRYLLDLVVDGDPPVVTRDNAAEILLAVRHLIFGEQDPTLLDTPEKQEAALETFTNLEGS